jgi:hypothetical protein
MPFFEQDSVVEANSIDDLRLWIHRCRDLLPGLKQSTIKILIAEGNPYEMNRKDILSPASHQLRRIATYILVDLRHKRESGKNRGKPEGKRSHAVWELIAVYC